MDYSLFKKKVLENLIANCNKDAKLNGIYNGKKTPHILNIECGDRLSIIKKFNLTRAAREGEFFIADKLHRFAHHLNSSQIMCYNFFRPFINNQKKPKKELIEIIRSFCPLLQFNNDAICEFEYVEQNGDGTNFDFYIRSGEINVYCEIKYTERKFSKSSSCKNPQKRYNEVYKTLIKNTQDLWTSKVSEKTVMHQYYQLFRNASKAKKGKSYVLFICPKDREDLKHNYDEFSRELLINENDMIQYVYWEQLIDVAVKKGVDLSEFINKYFGYK